MNNEQMNNQFNQQPANQNMNNQFNQQPINQNNMQQGNQFNNLNTQPLNMNMGQPVNQNYTAPQPEQGKKGNKSFIIIVIVLVLIIAVICYLFISKKPLAQTDENPLPEEDTPIQVANSDVYNYNDFEFPIPNGYVASEDGELLTLVNESNRVAIGLYVHKYVEIDEFKNAINQLKQELTSQGMVISSDTIKNVSGVDWIIIEGKMTIEGTTVNSVSAFAGLGDVNVLESIIYNFGSKSTDDIVKELSTMINNTKYKGSSNFSADGEKSEANMYIKDYTFDESLFK